MFKAQLWGAIQFRNALMGLFGHIKKFAEYTLFLAAQNVRDEMREEGKPSPGATWKPGDGRVIDWDSEKQRKRFFASDGFGRGIPTKRSGQAVGAWRAIRIEDGAQAFNPLSHIVFINGRRQSRIHRGRWKLFHVTVEAVLKRLPETLRKRVLATIQEQGFTAR